MKEKEELTFLKSHKIIIVVVSLVIISIAIFFLLITNNKKNDKIMQTNERNESVLQIEIITEYVNIRSEASVDSELKGKVNQGEIYTVIDKYEDSNYVWYHIETENNINGYIAGINGDASYAKELVSNSIQTPTEIPKEENKPQNTTPQKPNTNNNQNSTNSNENNIPTENKPTSGEQSKPSIPVVPDVPSSYITHEQELYNHNGVLIATKGVDYQNKDYWIDIEYYIENNSDVSYIIQTKNTVVNDCNIYSSNSSTLLPNTKTITKLRFLKRNYLEKYGITEIKKLMLQFVIIEGDTITMNNKKITTDYITITF